MRWCFWLESRPWLTSAESGPPVGAEVFVLRQKGNTVTGTIVGKPGEPVYKIVDGVIRGNRIHFFVLHEDESDPEVKANEGNRFITWRKERLQTRRLSFPDRGKTPRFANTA